MKEKRFEVVFSQGTMDVVRILVDQVTEVGKLFAGLQRICGRVDPPARPRGKARHFAGKSRIMADMPVISFYPRLPHGVSPAIFVRTGEKGRKMGSLPAKGADNLGISPAGTSSRGNRRRRRRGVSSGRKPARSATIWEYLCAYSVEGDPIDGVDKNYGVLYTATIETFEELPPMEMAECGSLPNCQQI